MPMIEQNDPATQERARKKISQLSDATDRGDLDLRYSIAMGWIAALSIEGLIDRLSFDTLMSELNATHLEMIGALPRYP